MANNLIYTPVIRSAIFDLNGYLTKFVLQYNKPANTSTKSKFTRVSYKVVDANSLFSQMLSNPSCVEYLRNTSSQNSLSLDPVCNRLNMEVLSDMSLLYDQMRMKLVTSGIYKSSPVDQHAIDEQMYVYLVSCRPDVKNILILTRFGIEFRDTNMALTYPMYSCFVTSFGKLFINKPITADMRTVIENMDVHNVRYFDYCFDGAAIAILSEKDRVLNLSHWRTYSAESAYGMFANSCFNQIVLNGFATCGLKNIETIFEQCQAYNIYLHNWNVLGVIGYKRANFPDFPMTPYCNAKFYIGQGGNPQLRTLLTQDGVPDARIVLG